MIILSEVSQTEKSLIIAYTVFPSVSAVKNLPAVQEMRETQVWSLVWEGPLEEGMATHSSILAWRILWTRGHPGGLQSMWSQRVGHDWNDSAHTHGHTGATVEWLCWDLVRYISLPLCGFLFGWFGLPHSTEVSGSIRDCEWVSEWIIECPQRKKSQEF